MKISDADVLFAIYLQDNNCTIEKLMDFFYKTNQEDESEITKEVNSHLEKLYMLDFIHYSLLDGDFCIQLTKQGRSFTVKSANNLSKSLLSTQVSI